LQEGLDHGDSLIFGFINCLKTDGLAGKNDKEHKEGMLVIQNLSREYGLDLQQCHV
jgi:hypothetical protein